MINENEKQQKRKEKNSNCKSTQKVKNNKSVSDFQFVHNSFSLVSKYPAVITI